MKWGRTRTEWKGHQGTVVMCFQLVPPRVEEPHASIQLYRRLSLCRDPSVPWEELRGSPGCCRYPGGASLWDSSVFLGEIAK